MTTVVHVRDVMDRLKAGDPEVVYIGRAMPRQGLKGSPWANHFHINKVWDREYAIKMYRTSLLEISGVTAIRIVQQKAMKAALRDLKGKTLACWCKPEACHGDVLAELADAA